MVVLSPMSHQVPALMAEVLTEDPDGLLVLPAPSACHLSRRRSFRSGELIGGPLHADDDGMPFEPVHQLLREDDAKTGREPCERDAPVIRHSFALRIII